MPMNAEQFRAALERLGMTQAGTSGADTFLGVGERTVRRWAVEEGPPDAVAMLLRLMIARRLQPDKVRALYADDRRTWGGPTRAKGGGS